MMYLDKSVELKAHHDQTFALSYINTMSFHMKAETTVKVKMVCLSVVVWLH